MQHLGRWACGACLFEDGAGMAVYWGGKSTTPMAPFSNSKMTKGHGLVGVLGVLGSLWGGVPTWFMGWEQDG